MTVIKRNRVFCGFRAQSLTQLWHEGRGHLEETAALAIVAGVALAFVPGAQGLGAALVAGAVLGGGASLIDQACTGYPIDMGQVGKDTLFGAAGGALGYGAGKGIQWAARTPAGQAVTNWASRQASRIPGVQRLAENLGAKSAQEASSVTDDALGSVATPAKSSAAPLGEDLVPYYPPNRGAAGPIESDYLYAGTRIDRYGSSRGTYVSPEGTPLPMRSLPQEPINDYITYMKLSSPFQYRLHRWHRGSASLGVESNTSCQSAHKNCLTME